MRRYRPRLSKQYVRICQLKSASTSGESCRAGGQCKDRSGGMNVAYWPEGNALYLFYGPTPISQNGKILAYSPVNIIGKIVDSSNKEDILNQIKDGTKVIIRESI